MSIQTIHPRIIQFYKDNPAIDFDTINLSFIDIFEKISMSTPAIDVSHLTDNTQMLVKQTLSAQHKMLSDHSQVVHKANNSFKPVFYENRVIENVLSRTFGTAEIIPSSTDTYMMRRTGKPTILF